MARARKASDDIYNARRRFRRQAERYMKKAEQETGAAKHRYEALARDAIENAQRLYAKDSVTGERISNIAREIGARQRVKGREVSADRKSRLINASMNALENTMQDETQQRNAEAKAILKEGNIGSRFYAGTIGIWENAAPEDRDQAIIDAFGAEDLMQVLEQLESEGIDIYEPAGNDEVYNEIAVSIMDYVSTNGYVQAA